MLSVQTKGLKLTPRIESYVEKKTEHIDRVMPTIADLQVELRAEKTKSKVDSRIAQVTLRDKKGTILRAEERNGDLFTAIDLAMDKLGRQIRRYRGKRLSNRRRLGGAWEEKPIELLAATEETDDVLDDEPKVVRHKQFSLQPMSLGEACDQAELIGHDFFVFFNREDNSVNVLYKRKDGNYGVLHPAVRLWV